MAGLGFLDFTDEVEKGVFRAMFDLHGHFRNDPRMGDVWVNTRTTDKELVSLVFTKVEESYREEGYILFSGELQNFGLLGDLLQIERMKELVRGGKKMKPVVLP